MKTRPASMLWDLIGRLANNCLAFRISGEPGVGKEAITHLIHRHYPHQKSKFIKFNCEELQNATNESKLTDTTPLSITALNAALNSPENKVFYFEHINLMPETCQTWLLNMLNQTYTTASPWVFASSKMPLENFKGHTLKPSLFKALDTVHIAVPPLRNHPDKIPQILSWFLHAYSQENPESMPVMPDPPSMDRLLNYEWPGNLRQLQKLVDHAFTTEDWDGALSSLDDASTDDSALVVDEIAAIYLMSLAKLSIQKDRIIEGFMVSSKMEDVGLLDLAIYQEAVSQIADHIDAQDDEPSRINAPILSSPKSR